MIDATHKRLLFRVNGQDFSRYFRYGHVRSLSPSKTGLLLRDGEVRLEGNQRIALDPRLNTALQLGSVLSCDCLGGHDPAFSGITLQSYPGSANPRLEIPLLLETADRLTFLARQRSPAADKLGIKDPVEGISIQEAVNRLLAAVGLPPLVGDVPSGRIFFSKQQRPGSSWLQLAGEIVFSAPGGPWWLWQDCFGAIRCESWNNILAQSPFLLREKDCINFSPLNGNEYRQPQATYKTVGTQLTVTPKSGTATIDTQYLAWGDYSPSLYLTNPTFAIRKFLNRLVFTTRSFDGPVVRSESYTCEALVNAIGPSLSAFLVRHVEIIESTYRADGLLDKQTYKFYQAPIYNPSGAFGSLPYGVPVAFAYDEAGIARSRENPKLISSTLSYLGWQQTAGRETTYAYNADLYVVGRETKELALTTFSGTFGPGGPPAPTLSPGRTTTEKWQYLASAGEWQYSKALSLKSALDAGAATGGTSQETSSDAPPQAQEYPLPYAVLEQKLMAESTLRPRSATAFVPYEIEPDYIGYVYDQVSLNAVTDWLAGQAWGLAEGYKILLPYRADILARLRQSPLLLCDLLTASGKTLRLVLCSPIFLHDANRGTSTIEFIGQLLGWVV